MPKPGPRTIHRYSDAFKAAAVRLSQQPGVRVSDVAQSLYIHPYMLSRWRRLARECNDPVISCSGATFSRRAR